MSGKIGIFLPGASGDICHAMSVLKYKEQLWPDKDVIWYCSLLRNDQLGYPTRTDLFKFNDKISEVRHWPEGFRLPEMCERENLTVEAKGDLPWADFSVLLGPGNRLVQERKGDFELTKDLDDGYFPGPWLWNDRPPNMHYGDVSKTIFGVDTSYPWRPYLCFSDEEKKATEDFVKNLPHKKTVMMETFMVSGDVRFTDEMITKTMHYCRSILGPCNFIFASNKDFTRFFDDPGVVSARHFTIRQCALVFNHVDLFIGVCSGISIAVSCWGNKPIPRIEWCGSPPISVTAHANGPVESIFYDWQESAGAQQMYYDKLAKVLNSL